MLTILVELSLNMSYDRTMANWILVIGWADLSTLASEMSDKNLMRQENKG